jgi:hypothetical protein
MKIYVAASHTERCVVQHLRDQGFDVISTWDIDDKDYQPDDPYRAVRDLIQIQQCDLFICGIGDEKSGGGRHTELGYAMGLGKVILLVGSYDKNVFERLFPVMSYEKFQTYFRTNLS